MAVFTNELKKEERRWRKANIYNFKDTVKKYGLPTRSLFAKVRAAYIQDMINDMEKQKEEANNGPGTGDNPPS